MSTLRSLLRLEDKVAAEGRRLEQIGGPSLEHLLPAIVVAAVAVHAAVLALPALKATASLPASSPPQDFPLVWRMAVPMQPAAPVSDGPLPQPAAGRLPSVSVPLAAVRPQPIEPVPEPAPELRSVQLAEDVEAVIPPPDEPPPSLEPDSPRTAPLPTSMNAPVLVHRVPPVYPVLARALHAEARVTVRVTVAADGSVLDATVLGCTRPGLGFEAAATDAVKRWRYEPQLSPAGPRPVMVTVDFKRQDERP